MRMKQFELQLLCEMGRRVALGGTDLVIVIKGLQAV